MARSEYLQPIYVLAHISIQSILHINSINPSSINAFEKIPIDMLCLFKQIASALFDHLHSIFANNIGTFFCEYPSSSSNYLARPTRSPTLFCATDPTSPADLAITGFLDDTNPK